MPSELMSPTSVSWLVLGSLFVLFCVVVGVLHFRGWRPTPSKAETEDKFPVIFRKVANPVTARLECGHHHVFVIGNDLPCLECGAAAEELRNLLVAEQARQAAGQ